MPFETPITIRDALQRIARREYLLPGIQREFVWDTDQIVTLFDSLARGYPIGSFLFWRVDEQRKSDYQFYEFLRDFHERDGRHNPKASVIAPGGLTAVLDGQQRLTSLNIGLFGTYSARRKRARREAASSYDKRRLYVNLAAPSKAPELLFDFRFREDAADCTKEGDAFWFRVGHILDFKATTDVFDLIIEQNLAQNAFPKNCLVQLHKAVTELPLINFFTETEQDLDRVLNVFIRVNSGGTPLSYSDLLLSIASAQWQERDAREEILALVDQINRDYGDFAFPRDFVLKSCLMLAELDLRWRIENFNQANMKVIERLWPKIAEAIRLAVQLVSSFGFSGATLASTNAVIPIVYYLYARGLPKGYVDAGVFKEDRELVRRWLNVVLLKRTFSGVPDSVLRPMRELLREHGKTAFPYETIVEVFRTTTYPLSFQQGELEGLLDERYGGNYAFPLLALMYPGLNYQHKLHLDHLHPKSHFSEAQLRLRGVPEEAHAAYRERADRIPNLQLLDGQPNIEKSNLPYADWLKKTYQTDTERAQYCERNYVSAADPAFGNFLAFYALRRQRMLEALASLVGVVLSGPSASEDGDDSKEDGEEPPVSFNADCATRVTKKLGIELDKVTTTLYQDSSGDTRVVILVSKLHAGGAAPLYWYGLHQHQAEFLDRAKQAHIAFGCGQPHLIVLFSWAKFRELLPTFNRTIPKDGSFYWHVKLFGDANHIELALPRSGERVPVSSNVI